MSFGGDWMSNPAMWWSWEESSSESVLFNKRSSVNSESFHCASLVTHFVMLLVDSHIDYIVTLFPLIILETFLQLDWSHPVLNFVILLFYYTMSCDAATLSTQLIQENN